MTRNSVRATVFGLMAQSRHYEYDEDNLIRDTRREHPKALQSTILRYRNDYKQCRGSHKLICR